jgi:uncharacterized membrane protein YesL
MGSKASAPIVIRENPVLACNMRDAVTMSGHNGLIIMMAMIVVGVCLVIFIVLIVLLRRHYHRKIRQYTYRSARPLTQI